MKNNSYKMMTRALIRAALVIALVTAAVFLLIRLVPGDPVVMVLGEHATDEAVNQLREQLHLNDSLGQQFLIFLQNVFLHADTGNSIKYGVSCRSLILQYAPVTLLLVVMSMTISIVISLLLSFTAATHKDGIADHLIRIIPIIAHGMPVFWIGLILTVIILFVGSSVARAFSLAGTLSIIRFRSAPGDPEDIGYIFFDIAAGLACGVGLYGYGALFVLLLCLFMIVISKIKFGKPNTTAKNLKITIPENLDYEGIFDEIIKKYSKDYTLQKVRTTDLGSLYELTYSVNMNKDADEKKFIDELRCRNGNLNIVLSLAATELYGK